MAEKSDEILRHIETTRGQLGRHIDELTGYVREKTDWRKHYDRKPWAFLGGSVVGGLLLAAMFIPGSQRNHRRRYCDY